MRLIMSQKLKTFCTYGPQCVKICILYYWWDRGGEETYTQQINKPFFM